MNVLQALWLRAQQEKQALGQGRLGLGPDPGAGSGVNLPAGPLAAPLLAPIHALGLIQEGAGNVAEAAMGTLGGAIVGGQQAGYYGLHPGETPSAQDQHYINAYRLLQEGHPIAANQEMGQADAFMNAIGTFALNPLNFTGPASEAGGVLGALGKAGHIVNELPVSPLKALLAAARADQGERTAAAGAAVLRALLGRAAAAADAGGAVARALADVPIESGVPLGPDLPGVQGPGRPGRRVVPETVLPETSSVPGNARRPLGPALPPLLDVPLPPEYGPAFPGKGDVPADQLIARIGRNGGKGIGPLLPEVPPTVLPIADLLGAARTTAQPTRLEALLGAARRVEGRLPDLPATPEVGTPGPDWTHYGPETIYPGEGVTPGLLDQFARLRQFPNPSPLDVNAEIGAMRDPVTLLQQTYGDQWQNRLAALTGGKWGQPGSGATLVNNRVMLGDLDLTTALRDYLENRGGPQAGDFKGALKALLPEQGLPTPAEAAPSLSAPPAAPAGTLDDVRNLIRDHAQQFNTRYPPLDPAFYAKRANVDPAQVPAMLDQLVQEGTLGRLPDGSLAVKPGAAQAADNITAQTPLSNVDIPATPETPELSKGHAGIVGDFEYFHGPDGALYRAPLANGLEVSGYRGGARFEATANNAQRALDIAGAIDANAIPTTSAGQAGLPGLGSRQGGDIAAGGGGGFGLLPPRLGATLAGAGVGTGVGGLAGGGLGLATGHRDDQLKADIAAGAGLGALAGGSVGSASPEIAQAVRDIAPHLAQATDGTWLSGTMLARAWRAGERAQTAAVGAGGAAGAGGFARALPGAWRAQAVNTLKQLPQDALNQAVTLWGLARDEFGIGPADIRYWQDHLAAERDARASSLQNPVTDRLRRLGLQRLLDPGQFGTVYGTDFLSSERAGQPLLSAKQSSVAGAIFSGYNGLPTLNPLSIGVGAVKGRFQPFINGFVQFANGVQHDAFRYAMADATLQRDIPPLASALVADLQARGVDVAPLVARGDFFSGADVARVAGPALGRQWDTLLEQTVRNGGDRIAFLAGDFRNKLASGYPGRVTAAGKAVGRAERAVGKAIPFIRWPLHYGPVLLEIAAAHPRLAAAAAGVLAQQQAQAQQLIKAGAIRADEAGSQAIGTDTPVLGAYARLRLGGQAGTVRVNPLGALVPYTQLLGGVQLPTNVNATGYERANAVLTAAGMSPNPAIQALAYATGNDTQAPGALSRTAGLEGLAGLLPGGAGRLSVPSLGAGLDAARQVVTGQTTTEYDPAMRRYAELVLDRTGRPLSDPANRAYLIADTPAARALFDQAKREVLVANAVGNLTSLTSPVGVAAHGADAQAIAEQRRMMYTPAQQIQSSPGVAALMLQANARYAAAHPAIGLDPATGAPATTPAAYAAASNSARERLLLGDVAGRGSLIGTLDPLAQQQIVGPLRYAIERTALR